MNPAFDIGANVGSVTKRLLHRYPSVWAFEPSPVTFPRLRERYEGHPDVRCFRLAFSSQSHLGHITNLRDGKLNSLSDAGDPVEIVTGDQFCTTHGVEEIPYLKIDTEGHDLEVLKGFKVLIEDRRVKLIEVECGMNPMNERHVPFADFVTFLEPRGYYIHQFTEQVSERGSDILRRANVLWTPGSPTARQRDRRRAV
jgi:FkbM family methyltransferase